MMLARRQVVIAGSAAPLALATGALHSQPARKPVLVGYLGSTRPEAPEVRAIIDAFRSEMRRLGWTEGSRVAYEFRFADGVLERFAALARELVALKPDLIVAVSASAVDEVKAATSTIPVVFVTPNPVEEGQVASLARPGGNLTGLAFLSSELIGKRMQLLKDAFPRISRVGYLAFEHPRITRETYAAARALQLELLPSPDTDRAEDLQRAIAAAPQADAWFVGDHLTYFANRRNVIDAITAQRKPAVYPQVAFVHAGGLMAYATDLRDLLRRAASYADRILRGAKPAELPVEQPTRFELVVNRNAARAIGVTLPQSLLLRADEVIE